ncbi:hypothetical protein [Algivirga pacifica]|uniref:Uncharacterized protein n=1 Tax=Algivirga pacifica TaxID=1162670 RepID=A0ABP9DFU5_9BACT
MKAKTIIGGIFSIIVLGMSFQAFAQSKATPGIAMTQVVQAARIKQGENSGELTRREARKLRRKQQKVQRMKWKAKEDGRVTAKERKKIRKAQKKNSRRIYRKKHNGAIK